MPGQIEITRIRRLFAVNCRIQHFLCAACYRLPLDSRKELLSNLYLGMGDSMIERLPISLKADYALKAIFDLTLQPPGVPIKIAEIAKRQKIPQKFLELILAGLKQGGFVESRRGAEGGYLLGRPAESMTVGEVLRFVEGSRAGRPRGKAQP